MSKMKCRLSSVGSFQSSSGRWPDATGRCCPAPPPGSCFNPHPATVPDATAVAGRAVAGAQVSILIRHGGRMPPRWPRVHFAGHPVSILIRHGGRMPPAREVARDAQAVVSILIRHGGRMPPPTKSSLRWEKTCFNPHPARWPDNRVVSILIRHGGRLPRHVSILIRHGGRMPPWDQPGRQRPPGGFQSSSGTVAGCHSGSWFSYLPAANLHRQAS